METTLNIKTQIKPNEECLHEDYLNGIGYVITKRREPGKPDQFVLYQSLAAPTLKDKSAFKPLFTDTSFGNVCYEMFRRGLRDKT